MHAGKEIKGEQFGVRFVNRGKDDKHIIIQLLEEDDENWFKIGNGFSSYWLDDLIEVLRIAKLALRDSEPSPDGYGFTFKE